MTSTTPRDRYCPACGAATRTAEDARCFACGAALDHAATLVAHDTGERLAPGDLLHDRYRIITQVGAGGYGAVYRARDTLVGDLMVAVKAITVRDLTPMEAIDATDTFNREIALLSELSHPSLPRVYDHFTGEAHWYLVMEFIEGETLEKYVGHTTRTGQVPLTEVLDIGIQLCTVLDYLHTRQPPIIFRDVKPANIMRTWTGHLCVIDFGIARRHTPGQTRDTIALGSPGYAAPEQYGRAQTNAQADIYSLGVTLHQLLTGHDPAETPFHLPPLDSLAPHLPPELLALIERMLDLDAGKRPASMAEVQIALQEIAHEQRRGLAPLSPASTGSVSCVSPATGHATGHVAAQRRTRWTPARFSPVARLAPVMVVLLVGLLLGTFALTFSPRNQDRPGTGPNTPPCATHSTAFSHPVQSGVELTEGLRLHMVTTRVGWAIGASAHSNTWTTVLRTTDGGFHWKQVTPTDVASKGIDDLYILDETTAWLLGQERWYRTTDAGATWQLLCGLQGWMQPFSFSDQNRGWMIPRSLSGETHDTSPLYTTNDGGTTWQYTRTLPFSSISQFHAITVQTDWVTTQEFSAKDVLSSRIALYVTHDAGRTWEQQQLPRPAGVPKKMPSLLFGPSFVSDKDGSLFAAFGQDATHDMYLYVTHDGGTSWQVQGTAIPGSVGVRSAVDGYHIIVDNGFVGGDIQMDLLTLSNGHWYQQDTHPVTGSAAELSFPSASTGLALVRTPSNSFDVYRTTNAGKTWQHIATLPSAS